MGDISRHFSRKEFECRCCGEAVIHPRLLLGLELLREYIGKPIVLTCGYRCPKHNRAVGGVENSYHTQGMAADIYVVGLTPFELAGQAARVPMFFNGGIGIYPSRGFVHVDVGAKRRWQG